MDGAAEDVTPEPERKGGRGGFHLPKPPIKSMTDFVVFAFVSIVTFTLFSAVIGILLTTLLRPEHDNSQTIGILADITTSLISALVGFLAGKGTGHQEATEREAEERQRQREHEESMK